MAARWPAMIAVMLAVGCGGRASQRVSHPRPASTTPNADFSGRVDVGGRYLYVECSGAGRPTVVLQAGWGGVSQDWASVLPELGRTTRTCAYDRAGLGASDPIPGVHDAGDEVRDLKRLLERDRLPAPYVLVGHSYGGLLARLFAAAHPQQTGGGGVVGALGRKARRRGRGGGPGGVGPQPRRAVAE